MSATPFSGAGGVSEVIVWSTRRSPLGKPQAYLERGALRVRRSAMAWRAARTSGLLAIALAGLAAAPAAQAQEPPVALPAEALTETMPPDLPPRPRFSLAVGMGATL